MSDKTHTSRLTSYKNVGHGMTKDENNWRGFLGRYIVVGAQIQYKKSVTHVNKTLSAMEFSQDLRRKRAELSVTLRKQAREEQLLKRRAVSPDVTTHDDVNVDERIYTPAEIVQDLKSADLAVKTRAARAGRRMLSKEQNPPITPMVEAGIIDPLVAALDAFECPDLQFEAAWALTNIASGTRDHTYAVVDGGAIPKLITLLGHGGVVAEQAAWALGNIAGDGSETRDATLRAGLLPALLPYLHKDTPPTQLRTNVWTYSNLCRNKNPIVDFESVCPALPYIAELLTIQDQDVLADTCWALSYLTDGPNERIEAVQAEPHLTQRLIALLAHKAAAVKTPALRALGNMLTGSDLQTDRCIDAGCIPHIISLLKCEKPALVKEAAWAASNILAGTHPQINKALESNILEPLIKVLSDGEPRCQKEAAWAITNLCLGGTAEQLDTLFAAGFLEPYCGLLLAPDHRTIVLVIDGLCNLLQAAEKYGQKEAMCLRLEELGVLEVLEKLQEHENEQVYKKVVNMLDTYFCGDNDENEDPAQNENEYQFGVKQADANFQF